MLALCNTCQSEIDIPPYRIKKYIANYCSRECHRLSQFQDINERFWKFVDIKGPDDCWEWTGSRVRNGYGKIGDGKRTIRAHRFIWEVTFGPIPEGLWVLHHCDNPPCVNLSHLFLGTAHDNALDAFKKGRRKPPPQPLPHQLARGEKHGSKKHPESIIRGEQRWNSRMNMDQILEIRRLYEQDQVRPVEIGKMFGISVRYIRKILSRKVWKHI